MWTEMRDLLRRNRTTMLPDLAGIALIAAMFVAALHLPAL